MTVVVVAGGGLWLWKRSRLAATPTASAVERVVPVTAGPLRQTVTALGTLQPAVTENLGFTVAGKVTAVPVKAGQAVTKGTVLATIDSASLQSQVTQAQATLDSAIAKQATDQAAATSSSALLAADQANVAAAAAQLADARSALAGATLTAPIDGTVASVGLSVGEELGGGGGLGDGSDGHRHRVRAHERHAAGRLRRIGRGQRVHGVQHRPDHQHRLLRGEPQRRRHRHRPPQGRPVGHGDSVERSRRRHPGPGPGRTRGRAHHRDASGEPGARGPRLSGSHGHLGGRHRHVDL
ncbi:MAG: biotin/lipoyl-binding protein, partial [Acidimicrobiales bacterium]